MAVRFKGRIAMEQKKTAGRRWGALEKRFFFGGMALIIIVSAVVAFYHQYLTTAYTETLYYGQAVALADIAADLGQLIRIGDYAGDAPEDAKYADVLEKLNVICQKTDVLYIYFDIPNKSTHALEHVMAASDIAIPQGHHYILNVNPDDTAVMSNFDAMVRVYEGSSTREQAFLSNESGNVMTAYVPVYQDGAIIAVAGVDIAMDTILSSVHNNTLIIGGGIIAVFTLFVFIYLHYVRRVIIKPVEVLSDEMTHFISEDNLTRNDAPSTIAAGGEIGQMVAAFNSMKSDIRTYSDNLAKAAAESERIRTELALAAKIQLSNLPAPFPQREDLSLDAVMKPAKEVGGDFYDYFMLDDTHLAVVMADVAGKGVPAALFAMRSKALLSDSAAGLGDPAAIMARANRLLCQQNEACIFVTAFLGILDTESGRMIYTNAAHTLPAICGPGGCRFLDMNNDFVLGGMEETEYHTHTCTLKPGDRFFLYTDGITEAFGPGDVLFGSDRLLEALAANDGHTGKALLKAMAERVANFAQGVEQSDDMTMLVLDYRRSEPEKRLELTSDIAGLEEVRAFILGALPAGVADGIQSQLELIVEEVFVNICNYAYADSGPVTISCGLEPDVLTLTFEDAGKPFDPLAKEDPDLTIPADQRDAGGLGIYLTRQLADAMDYARVGDMNRLTIRKKLHRQETEEA
jgi:sigma-B regulation protein RsbU (phosphoserine phosphatase)